MDAPIFVPTRKTWFLPAVVLLAALCHSFQPQIRPPQLGEYHVSTGGNDCSNGTTASPFRTISAAAEKAQPGDVIIVHEGVYRERINPPRGGESDDKRIVYRASEGEEVVITGSEIVKNWQHLGNGLWGITLPDSFFGDYNPYLDVISGDWFISQGRDHHTGDVYLNGKALFEEISIEQVETRELSWFCRVNEDGTHIWANFVDSNPNTELTEINVRPLCFYPDRPGINYLTVRGFIIRQAATQWAPPTAEQQAAIGTHWSKGWIIEDNVIHDSKCVGLTLGKYGDEFDNTSANSAEGYVKTIERALERGWSRETVGSHIVRNNTIHTCGAAGICGSMGGIFSEITGNHIYNINIDKPFSGHEMAGLKLHAPIDALIQDNRIHHTSRGIWLDWMTQGARVSGNLLYSNGREDLFVEVNHGPFLIDNNIFLTANSLRDWSQGGTYVHNIFLGRFIIKQGAGGRETPYHLPHSTAVAGLSSISGGDNRFYNNILAGSGLDVYDGAELPLLVNGNVYLSGAQPYKDEVNYIQDTSFNPAISLTEEKDGIFLLMNLPDAIQSLSNQLVTTSLLGLTEISGARFENPDGTALRIDHDYAGMRQDIAQPATGPFTLSKTGAVRVKVWPKSIPTNR
jgi:alpha-N-arabinofuranosidase